MRRFRVSAVAGAVLLLGLLSAGPAAAQQGGRDHLHVDLALVSCGTLEASGSKLPAATKLDVRFVDAATDRTLHQVAKATDADGALEFSAKVPLGGVDTVRMTVARPGAGKPYAFSELTIPGTCPLPFTGPARAPTLAAVALFLILLGSMLVGASAYRGRHRAGRHLA